MLKHKMFRELKLYFSQFITIFLMVFIGVMAYSGIKAYMNGMQITADNFYEENNLQDLNVIGSNFTMDDLNNVKKLKNVKNVERKLVFTATTKKDSALLVSFIEENDISKLYILDGEKFDLNKKGLWLDSFYAKENNIKIGDIVEFKYDNFTFKEKVLGIINVPDHVYDTKDESELYANRKEFGFCYLSIKELDKYIKYKTMNDLSIDEEAFNKLNINYKDNYVFNNIMVDVDKRSNVKSVKNSIEKNIKNSLGVIDSHDTYSYIQYQGEINEGKSYVGIFSGLFIFIAMLSVITTMTRIVRKQKVQIGTLKALGFKDRKIIFHYISYSLIVSVLGSILGLIGGYFFIGKMFMGLEMSFFEIPNGKPIMDFSSYITAVIVVLIVVLVTYISTRKNLKEEPANILRNEIPNVNNRSINFTNNKFFKNMNFNTKWNIRDMFRNKTRTITALAGITGCCMLIVCAFGMKDSMNNFIKIQFTDLCNFKYKLTIKKDINEKDLNDLYKKYGNSTSKSLLIEFKDKNKKIISNNLFINDSNNKVRFIDDEGNFKKLNRNDGIFVTYKFASNNNFKIGDTVKWKIMGDEKYYSSKIIGFNKDPQNQNITMTRSYYESLGLKYNPDFIYTDNSLKDVKDINGISLIQDKNKLRNSMDLMLSAMRTMVSLIIFIAVVLGIVIIYNMGILSYTEKEYQFATLKVLGFKDNKIRNIFIKQNIIISIISIIIGLPLGFFLVSWLFKNALEEGFDFNAHVTLITYIISAIGTFLVSFVVSKLLSRKINRIDMVSSLKGNE